MIQETEQEQLIRYLKGVRYVVINVCHGGYSLSREAEYLYLKRSLIDYETQPRESRHDTERYGPLILVNGKIWYSSDISRDDPVLVSVVRELGAKANGDFAELKITGTDLPDGDIAFDEEPCESRDTATQGHQTIHLHTQRNAHGAGELD